MAALFKEYPFAAVILPKFWNEPICFVCFRETEEDEMLGCNSCRMVKYCSKKCQNKDVVHKLECVLVLTKAGRDPNFIRDYISDWKFRLFIRIYSCYSKLLHDRSNLKIQQKPTKRGYAKIIEEDIIGWPASRRSFLDTSFVPIAPELGMICQKESENYGLMFNCSKEIDKGSKMPKADKLLRKFEDWLLILTKTVPECEGFNPKEHAADQFHLDIAAILSMGDLILAPITATSELQKEPKTIGMGFYREISQFSKVCGRQPADVEIHSKSDEPALQIVCASPLSNMTGPQLKKLLGSPEVRFQLTRSTVMDFKQINRDGRFLKCVGKCSFHYVGDYLVGTSSVCFICERSRQRWRELLTTGRFCKGDVFLENAFPVLMEGLIKEFEVSFMAKDWKGATKSGKNISEILDRLRVPWRTTWVPVFLTKMGRAVLNSTRNKQKAMLWYQKSRDAWSDVCRGEECHVNAKKLDEVIQILKQSKD